MNFTPLPPDSSFSIWESLTHNPAFYICIVLILVCFFVLKNKIVMDAIGIICGITFISFLIVFGSTGLINESKIEKAEKESSIIISNNIKIKYDINLKNLVGFHKDRRAKDSTIYVGEYYNITENRKNNLTFVFDDKGEPTILSDQNVDIEYIKSLEKK